MAIVCDPATVVKAANCFQCVPHPMQKPTELYLLAQIAHALNAAVSTDPATLVKAANCFQCIDKRMREPVEEYLLCQIAAAAGA